MMDDNAAPNPM
jgi:hypothetical protein